ncbi:MAG: hypothetical protein OHK0046_44710 [Anaerolineae bacterium]
MLRQCILLSLLSILLWAAPLQAQSDCTLTPRLSIGEQARVLPGQANNVRDSASTDGARLGQLTSGTVMDVLEGPVCAEGYTWWRVESGAISGWTVEGADGEYWLEPLTEPDSASLPTATISPLPTRKPASDLPDGIAGLEIGGRARITTSPEDSLRVRSGSGTDFAIVERLPNGAVVDLIGEPIEAEGLVWWPVRTESGTEGWAVAEVEDNGQLVRTLLPLCPYTTDRLAFNQTETLAGGTQAVSHLITSDHQGNQRCLIASVAASLRPGSQTIIREIVWSPDGQRIAFTAWGEGYVTVPYVVNADGSNLIQLVGSPGFHEFPTWSPDSARLGFLRAPGDAPTSQVWVIRADGTGAAALTSTNNRKRNLYWSPNDNLLAYVEIETGGDQIYTLSPERAVPEAQLAERYETIYTLGWMENGTRLLYDAYGEGVFVLDLTTGETTRLLSGGIFPNAHLAPAASPDNTQMAYFTTKVIQEDIYEGVGESLMVMNLDMSAEQAPAETALAEQMLVETVYDAVGSAFIPAFPPQWSPDGQLIAYTDTRGVYVVSVADGQVTRITEGGSAAAAWQP